MRLQDQSDRSGASSGCRVIRVTHQRLLTRTLHEVAEDTLDGAFRERRVVLGHVFCHQVNVERFLVAHARIVLAVGLARVVVVF